MRRAEQINILKVYYSFIIHSVNAFYIHTLCVAELYQYWDKTALIENTQNITQGDYNLCMCVWDGEWEEEVSYVPNMVKSGKCHK